LYSGANVKISAVALALINETSKRVNYLCDLQDAGYDGHIIRDFSKKLNHRPLIDINPKNSKELKAKIELQKEKRKFEMLHLPQNSDTHHHKQRSMVERVNKYLKEDCRCNTIYYQDTTKVASVLAIGDFIYLYPSVFEVCYLK